MKKVNSMIRSMLLTAFALTATIAAPAFAQEPPVQASQNINISQVDLRDEANWRMVDRQVAAAAETVCHRIVQASDRYSADVDECVENAKHDAQRQMRQVLARQEADAKVRFANLGSTARHG